MMDPWAPGIKIHFVYKYFPTIRLPFFQKNGDVSGSFILKSLVQSFPKL